LLSVNKNTAVECNEIALLIIINLIEGNQVPLSRLIRTH